MRRLAERTVVYAVGAGLFAAGWVLLGAFALGDRFIERIPRREQRGDYV